MSKDNLFQLIRNEEVIIWAGAGLSINAGYPSGQKLGEILVENLSKAQKETINENLLLPDLAEEFYRLKNSNRNALISILNKTFKNIQPTSTDCHDKIALIPHFKTIITTNYDTLLEDSYMQKAQVIISGQQIPYLSKESTHIFKVHGDLSVPDSIIITKSDYNNFFKLNSENDVYWTVIKERLSTKSVLFLGYNLEDPNVSVVFDRITDALGSNKKECFLVAPNLPQHKVNNLLLKGIQYINQTAEELIPEVIQNLKEHIIDDLEKGKTSADTFREFLSNIDILPELKTDKNSYQVKSLKGANEKIEGKMNFTFTNDPEFIKELNAFTKGEKFGNFEVPNDKLINADFSFGGVKFPNVSEGGIHKLEFKSNPKFDTVIDLRFEDNYEFNEMPIKVFVSKLFIEVHAELKSAKLVVKVDLSTLPETKVTFNYNHNEICKNVKEEIALFKLLKKLGEGKTFTVYKANELVSSKAFNQLTPLAEHANFFLAYFTNLKIIEKNYKIRFSNISINSVTEETFEKVALIVSAIKQEKVKYVWDDALIMDVIDHSEITINQLKSVNELNQPVTANNKIEEIIELHGHNINIGYKNIQFLEAYIENLESIISKKDNEAIIKSKSKTMIVSYTKTVEEY